MRNRLGVAALALLLVALLMATNFTTGSSSNAPGTINAISVPSTLEMSLSNSLNENFIQTKQFQAGTVFDNQSYLISVDPLSQDFAVGDLNNDSLSDVAVISKQPSEICIYNKTSNGALSAIPWKLSKDDIVDMRSIAIGNLNNDGRNDFVVSYNDLEGNGRVAI